MTSAASSDRSIFTVVPFADCNLQFEYNESAPMDAELRLWASKAATGGLIIDLDTHGGKSGTGGIESLSYSLLRSTSPGWHHVEVNASLGSVSVRVDGKASGSASGLGSRAGYIGFSTSGVGTLQVRNVKLKPLNLINSFNGSDLSGWKSVATEPLGKGGKAGDIVTFGIGGGVEKPHEAKWSVKEGAIHGEAGPGALENDMQVEDAIIQMNVAYRGDAKQENLTSFSLRNTPGKIGTGYQAGLGPFAGTVNHVGKAPLGKSGDSMEETIVIAGRTIATWVNGSLVSVHNDSRPDASSAVQGARTQPGTAMLLLPNDHEQINVSRLTLSNLPRVYGLAANAPAPPQTSTTSVASPTPAATTSASDSAAMAAIQKQQKDQAQKDAQADANKQRVASLISGALVSSNPQQQAEMYRQALQLDPANPNAVQGFKDAQAKLQAGSAQTAISHEAEMQKLAVLNYCNTLVQGQLAYQPTATMREGQKTYITARIARGEDKEIMVDLLNGKKEPVLVTCTVNAYLTAPDKHQFDIEEDDPVSQPRFLTLNTAEQWKWQVIPLTYGKKMHLLLSVVPLVSGPSGTFPTRLRTIDREIEVTANRPYEVKKAFGSLWAIFGGAAFLGGGVATLGKWLLSKYKGRQKKLEDAPKWETL